MSRARDIANLQSGGVINDGSVDLDFRIESNGNANMLFVDGGNDAVVIGHNNANDGSVSSAFSLQNIGTSYNSSSIGLARFSADVNAPSLVFHKSRNASIGGDTVVADNDELGRIRFFGNDGTDFAEGARITAIVNGTPGGGDMPTELVFATSADGAESPTIRFRIASDGSISTPTAGTSNTRLGVNAGNSIVSGGNENVVIGDEAGTAITQGDFNTSVGYSALTADTLGSRSVAVGTAALQAQNFTSATNTYNTAVGFQAGKAVTTGVVNTLIGGLSGDALTVGESNVAVGYASLSADTKGNNNVAIGREALAAQNFTTATDSYNSAVGYRAGFSVTTGVKNTLIGALAGDAITEGLENIMIGYNTGTITTGDSNIVIGSQNVNSSATVNNEIFIGRAGAGSGANTFTIGYGDTDVQINIDGSDTSWSATSDERLKDNINPLSVGLDFINELRPVTYEWKERKDVDESLGRYYKKDSTEPCRGSGGVNYGLIAQEVKTVIDKYNLTGNHHIWKESPDGSQVIGIGNVMPILIKAIQELSAEVTKLKGE